GEGQARAVVNRDVHVLPADGPAVHAGCVPLDRSIVAATDATNALAGAALDAPELLDVDMDQLTWALALVALRGLKTEPPELAHPDAREDPRDRGERHAQRVGDLRACEAQSAQSRDRLHSLLFGAVRDRIRRRGAIQQPELALGAVAPHPLAGTADADFGGLGRPRHRPLLLDHPPAQHPAPIQTESSVSVKIHPVSSLRLSRLAALSLQGGPDGPTYSGITARPRA